MSSPFEPPAFRVPPPSWHIPTLSEIAAAELRRAYEPILAEQSQFVRQQQDLVAAAHAAAIAQSGAGDAAAIIAQLTSQTSMMNTVRTMAKSIGNQFSTMWAAIQSSTHSFIGKLAHIDYKPIFDGLTMVVEAARRTGQQFDARGRAAMAESGFAFVIGSHETALIWRYGFMDAPARGSALTNRALAQIRSREFRDEFEFTIRSSPTLAPRWPAVRDGLSAHFRREYYGSVATLLCVLEGMIGDVLVLERLAVAQGHKLYDASTGNEVRGAGTALSKLRRADVFTPDTDEARAAEFLMDSLIGSRNAVLHGRDMQYGRAKRSAQVILLLRLFAGVVRFAEGAVQR